MIRGLGADVIPTLCRALIMESLLFIRAAVTLFCLLTVLALTWSQQTAQYFFYQTSEYPKDCRDVQRQCSTSNSSGVYVIKPDGFQEPFEVFCDIDVSTGGWTVIERRESGNVNFNRTWLQYKNGFGFLSTDFWLGNEKLAYLTNQAAYELLIEAELSNGSFFYTSYKDFRISDEFGKYSLQPLGNFESNGSLVLSSCPANVYFNNDCTEMCSCDNNGLECDAISCDTNAACIDIGNGVRNCSCNDGYEGDGITCTAPTTVPPAYKDCMEIFDARYTESKVYTILPDGWTNGPFDVFCEMGNGGGWTVFQRRTDGGTNFDRNWDSYKNGFGDKNDEFWLGNEKLHYLTHQKDYQLRLDIRTSSGTPYHGVYTEFQIGDESDKYRMDKLGDWSTTSGGYAGKYLYYNRGKQFSTPDEDNDECSHFHCGEKHKSGWWHGYSGWCDNCIITYSLCDHFQYNGNCYSICTDENLNGVYNGGNGEKIFSYGSDYCDPQFVELKIRPTS